MLAPLAGSWATTRLSLEPLGPQPHCQAKGVRKTGLKGWHAERELPPVCSQRSQRTDCPRILPLGNPGRWPGVLHAVEHATAGVTPAETIC